MKSENEFFIGWEGAPAPRAVKKSRAASIAFLVFALVAGAAVALVQSNFLSGTSWDFTVRKYEGILITKPVPLLIGTESGTDGKAGIHYLVLESKHAPKAEELEAFHLKSVKITGSRIADSGQPVEIIAILGTDAVSASDAAVPANPLPDGPLKEVTLRGEIIDSKCALGAMNPALYKTHRACAIRCISGGIPPLVRVAKEDGSIDHILLVGENGEAINAEILDFVALPVEIHGQMQTIGDWKLVCASPSEIRLIE